jgi:signal transduction histidine kinase
VQYIDLMRAGGDREQSNVVSRVLYSEKKELWIQTNNGLFRYRYPNGPVERIAWDVTAGVVLPDQDINSMALEKDGTLWIGCWRGGLNHYNPQTGELTSYGLRDGMPSMSVQGILVDEKSNSLWISTFEGISRFDRSTGQFKNYTVTEGIHGQMFADGSFLRSRGGYFFFGGQNGLTFFRAGDVEKPSLPPNLFLTDLKVGSQRILPSAGTLLEQPLDLVSSIRLRHNQNSLGIGFNAIHYSNPDKNKILYRLDNFDPEWREAGTIREAFYPNLPPGDYNFRLKAANNLGVWTEGEKTLRVTVLPPFWKTRWAYAGYGLLFMLLMVAFDRYRRQRLLQQEAERNKARELEHAREIEKAYAELKATQSQLIHREKMASLGELTAGIAHEIQNPLNFVTNFSEVSRELLEEMKQEMELGRKEASLEMAAEVGSNLEKIHHHGRRADAIVKAMLQHSQVSSGRAKPEDLNELAEEYASLAYHGAEARDPAFNATLVREFTPGLEPVVLVRNDLGRVLVNLLSNAFYSVWQKKKEMDGDYQPTVWIRTSREGDHHLLSVRDNGRGIPPNLLTKIFQPFFTTKPTGTGTGLGLSISYDIVRAHGAELTATSVEGQGAEFVIRFSRNGGKGNGRSRGSAAILSGG